MKKEKIKFLLISILIGLLLIFIVFIVNKRELNNLNGGQISSPVSEDENDLVVEVIDVPIEVEFMTEAEKLELGIDRPEKVQILNRNELGNISEYKIIIEDSEIINNLNEIPEADEFANTFFE